MTDDKIERPEETDRGLVGQVLDAAENRGGQDYLDGAYFAIRCLRDWGVINTDPFVFSTFPRMHNAEIIEALRVAAGFFNRPGDLRFEAAEVASYGVVSYAHIVGQGVAVLREGGLSFRFTTGLDALDGMIASLLMRTDQISALMLIAHAARIDDMASSPMEVEEALNKLRWRLGGVKPEPSIIQLEDDVGEKLVLRLASKLWVTMGFYRMGGQFEHAKGTPAYEDCVRMARETLS